LIVEERRKFPSLRNGVGKTLKRGKILKGEGALAAGEGKEGALLCRFGETEAPRVE